MPPPAGSPVEHILPLHLTKIAFGTASADSLRRWLEAQEAEAQLTTRYLPKRHAQMAGGSLHWIFHHALVARSPILRFDEAPGGRTHIVLAARLIEVRPVPRRAHQGWRYLAEGDAPPDIAGADADSAMPPGLVSELAKLGLV